MIKKIFILCFIISVLSLAVYSNPYPAFFYGYRMNPLPENNIYGLLDNYPFTDRDYVISFSYECSVNTEDRQRRMFQGRHLNYAGRNTYASTTNRTGSLNNALIKLNNFAVTYRKEYSGDYSFTQNIYDQNNNLFKRNHQSSSGSLKSLNVFYSFPEFRNLTVTAGLNYKQLEHNAVFSEEFQLSLYDFLNFNVNSSFINGAGLGYTFYFDYKHSLRVNYILTYKTAVTFDGQYESVAEDEFGTETVIDNLNSIEYPYELGFTSIIILPSQFFTRMYISVLYKNWSDIKDSQQYGLPEPDLSLNSTLTYSLGIRYRISKTLDGGVSFLYEPSYLNKNSKKIGITAGGRYRLNDRLNVNAVLNYTHFSLQYRYPFNMSYSEGERIERTENDLYNNQDVRLNMGLEIKL